MNFLKLNKLFTPPIWRFLGLLVVWIVLCGSLMISGILNRNTFTYWLQPLFLGAMAILIWRLTRQKVSRLRRLQEKLAIVASVMALWAIIYFLSGLETTFVQNPLAASFKSILFNLEGYLLPAALIEYIRWRLVLSTNRKKPLLTGAVILIVLSLLSLNFTLLQAANLTDVIKTVISVGLPLLVHGAVATYLAYVAGFAAQLVYRLSWEALALLLPILPKYDWYMNGMAALLVGLAIVILVDRTRQDRPKPLRFRHQQVRRFSDGLFVILLVSLTLFMTGAFSYRPIAIMSNSMQPVYSRGDMVVVQRANGVDISIGDILQYQVEGRIVTHRVADKQIKNGEVFFVTKGDNSSTIDPWLVRQEQVMGLVRARIPLIGYPTVLLNEIIKN